MTNTKIGIIGAGKVGESAAQTIVFWSLAKEMVLVDLDESFAQGVALDIQQTAHAFGSDIRIHGSSKISAVANSDIIVITAGIQRKVGMDRADVLATNLKIMTDIMAEVKQHASNALVIIVSNPVDVLTYFAAQSSGWPRNRLFGQAGVLDSMRMATFIASETGVSTNDIQALALGGHGDTMVPLPRYTTIGGAPISQYINAERLQEINDRTRTGGAEVLGLKKNSSAYSAPGVSVAVMVRSIVEDKKRILPTVALLDGEYNQNDLAIGVPVVLGRGGIENIVELDFDTEERAAFEASATITRTLIEEARGLS